MPGRFGIIALLIVQLVCAVLFLWNTLISVLGLPPLAWEVNEFIEIGAACGLLIGVAMGIVTLRDALRRAKRAESQLRAASGAFMDLLQEKFLQWGLTPAERDVALFAIKGFSLSEIAQMRQTSEGTVKAQTNAIYRKAGVSGRPQLLSIFIEDLIEAPISPLAAAPTPATLPTVTEK
ncbi:helix-turn-helix transcriptional regulator [Ketogulonicigenium vulgare]|uniref:Transcriptional regulator, LuxR family protein n=1 Tax=Ketogulonicigenium vulgare (strain WSH-001) TaxID=759362 RepID=F9Y4T7_KETVW|nr:LuxR C-terminal-related transcriptional regulator [Ketogulonicigenium vulgare]ADO43544.1 transcriptional regulator [Ketogulonicigenium vulgare Y25]AEM41821.1 Transcriptional regulator, LuxR family protein [Ketogulonicigenium vulgare WSH-001]ALJ81928.1 LuxR family transcriptional regulator [Ketogulonicigenium vulgare]ANW34571.1 helix-turn-helix transcriptional regulator [Ketogulonicigenium vulgare]AOZ55579.1 transcriptional regulator [Ketogulonicigenium vulgare]